MLIFVLTCFSFFLEFFFNFSGIKYCSFLEILKPGLKIREAGMKKWEQENFAMA